MSYTEIYVRYKNKKKWEFATEIHNGSAGALHLWFSMEKKYLPSYEKSNYKFYEPGEYKSRWTCGDEARQEIWDLSSDLRLTYEELMVFRSTMDDSKILGEDIPEFIKCLRVVGEEHGGNYIEQANKLQEFIDKEDISKISAISYNQTSVCCASDIFGEYYDAPLKKFWDCMITRDAYINFKKEKGIG